MDDDIIQRFLAEIQQLPPPPDVSLDQVLKPALEYESELRKAFASARDSDKLKDPHVGLVDLFGEGTPDAIRHSRPRVVSTEDDEAFAAQYVMPLPAAKRRKEGEQCIVSTVDEFKKNWAVFTEGSLGQLLDWSNVVAAGGSVLSCIAPLSEQASRSRRNIRRWYHQEGFPTSDVDLFLWGLNVEQAEAKIKTIYEAVRDSIPWDVTCVRTKHTVSIHSQYPYRCVQIVLRLYQSPAEILAGFDIDAPCCAYDGTTVWANPRAIVATMRQCNTVDMSRRSPSYEVRLAKYASRGFEVYIPNLKRVDIDPTIFERSVNSVQGMARLLVLEKLTDLDKRYAFLESRRTLRGRPTPIINRGRQKKKYKGDLKGADILDGLEQNDYDVETLHIPYGPGWDAKRIDKLIYSTDLGMNSTFNPKNKKRRLHRHPAFFGTVEECMEDCCEMCPDPVDDDEKKLQAKEDEKYIRGRIQFIEDNPGRQSISGSFNPIDVGEWSDQVYIKPTQQLYSAIAAHDEESVKALLKDLDVNQRDHVGRTPLHLAILCKAQAIACHLIDADARITARLVDGRTPLHLAAQFDLKEVLAKLFERSAKNFAEEKKKDPTFGDKDGDAEMKDVKKKEKMSSEDDWSAHSDDDVEMVSASEAKEQDGDEEDEEDKDDSEYEGASKDEGASEEDGANSIPERTPSPTDEPQGDIPEDEKDEPDVIDPNLLDWDFGFTPLAWAILYGSVEGVSILISNGADINVPTKRSSHPYTSFHPLELTILRQDEDEACAIAEFAIKAGVSCSTANKSMWTTFHRAVSEGRYKLVETFLRIDRKAVSSLNFPALLYSNVVFPVTTAIGRARYATLAILLSYDTKLVFDEADVSRAIEAAPDGHSALGHNVKNYLQPACLPVEAALDKQDDVIQLLLALGAAINQGVKGSTGGYTSDTDRATFWDWVQENLKCATKRIANLEKQKKALNAKAKTPPKKPTWKQFFEAHRRGVVLGQKEIESQVVELEKKLLELRDIKEYLQDAKRLMEARGAKGWKEVYPEETRFSLDGQDDADNDSDDGDDGIGQTNYAYVSDGSSRRQVPEHLKKAYDELFAACFAGDDKKVEKLCKEGLSGKGANRAHPLKTAVYLHGEKDVNWGASKGYTPLFAALEGKRWSTVKLILKIVAEQYHPAEKKDAKYNPKVRLSEDDSGSDEDADSDEDYNSEEGEETEREDSKKFYDVGEHSATARSDVSPRRFLDVPVPWRKVNKKGKDDYGESPLIEIAVINNNFEAFVQLASLYEVHSVVDVKGKVKDGEDGAGVARGGPKLNPSLVEAIVTHDCPEILDEFIRRTGYGVEVKAPDANGDGDDEKGSPSISTDLPSNDANRLYLGLNVHGKKRKDLATANDPNAYRSNSQHSEVPLVWLAAQEKAVGVFAYLGSGKPLEAYKKYALEKGGNEIRAVLLRRLISAGGFDTALRGMLGWYVDELGQSPVFAATVAGDISVLKEVERMEPELFKVALGRRLKFINFNMLTVAVCLGHKPEVLDYLLEKGQDPTAVDSKGYNIYHHACKHEQAKLLLAHLLAKLPREVSEQLLRQESKKCLFTPLHVAVRKGRKDLSQLIIDFFPATIEKRNVDGQTPLHIAASKGRASILSSLIFSATRSLDVGRSGALIQEEDGVGNTILDIALLHELEERTTVYTSTVDAAPGELSTSSPCTAKLRYGDKKEIELLEGELAKLKDALHIVKPREKAKRRTKVIWELGVFVGLLEKRIGDAKVKLEGEVGRILKACEDAQKAGESDDEDVDDADKESRKVSTKEEDAVDRKTTLHVVLDALKQVQSGRQLVHVSHVQRSVHAGLENVKKTENRGGTRRRYNEGVDLDTVEDKDQKMKDKSLLPWIFNYEEVEEMESAGAFYY